MHGPCPGRSPMRPAAPGEERRGPGRANARKCAFNKRTTQFADSNPMRPRHGHARARARRSPDLHQAAAPGPQNATRCGEWVVRRRAERPSRSAHPSGGDRRQRRLTGIVRMGAEGIPFSLREDRWRGTPAVSWYVVGDDVYPALAGLSCTPWPKSRAAFWPSADQVQRLLQRRAERSGTDSTRAERPPSPGPLSGGDATPHRNTKRDPDRGTARDTPSTPGGRLRGQSQDDVVLRRRSCGYTSSVGVTQVTKLKIL